MRISSTPTKRLLKQPQLCHLLDHHRSAVQFGSLEIMGSLTSYVIIWASWLTCHEPKFSQDSPGLIYNLTMNSRWTRTVYLGVQMNYSRKYWKQITFFFYHHYQNLSVMLELTYCSSCMLPSGNLTVRYWKWPWIVELPIKHGDFP